MENFLITESMVLKHSVKVYPDLPTLDKLSMDQSQRLRFGNFSNTCDYCEHVRQSGRPQVAERELLPPAIAVPFYYAALSLSLSPLTVVAFFVIPLMISLTCLVIFCFSLEVYKSRKIAFVLSLVFGVCSFIWPNRSDLVGNPVETLHFCISIFHLYFN